ncbi:MAG: VWA domain-containing protein [Saprospiraceae bacterium]|nr:VWA domain-containing protein [Saprospiraceae bacterium]
MKKSLLILVKLLFLIVKSTTAQPDDFPVQTESPYFLIQKEGINTEQFPLLSTKVKVDIVGPIADVVIEQTYKNNSKDPIEATYVFPASTRAAVYDLKMIIGNRIVQAQIKEKEEARKDYLKAKEEGKRATLLEQYRPNVFQMNVLNIMPGDLIKVVLRYNEFIIPESQEYTYVFPTVVGPRFVSEKNRNASESFAANPYLHQEERSPYIFDIKVDVDLPVAIHSISSSSHQLQLNFENKYKASARLSPQEINGGNRDFILTYSMSGEAIDGGTILYDHGDEQFFLTMIEPPRKGSFSKVLPREFIFVIDVSGSMHGFPLETTKELIKNLIAQLQPTDLFNVLLFAGGNQVLAPHSLPATNANLTKAMSVISRLEGSGSTEIIPAFKEIYSLPKSLPDLSRSIVVITDGYVSVEPEIFDLIGENIDQGNVFALGIGSGVNRYLIEGIAHAGRGEAIIVTKPESARDAAERFRSYIQSPVLTNIEIDFSGLQVYDLIPDRIPDLMAERPIYVFGKYRGTPSGSISITGDMADGKFHKNYPITRKSENSNHAALRYLWAREMIREHHDFLKLTADENRISKVTALGLKYNLLTDYTSFIAIDEVEKVNTDGSITRIKQPLPLPQNVSNYAVGFEMGVEGVSHQSQTAHTFGIALKLQNISDPVRQLSLEKALTNEIQKWPPAEIEKYKGKIIKILFGKEWSDLKVTIDGADLPDVRIKQIMLVLLSNKVRCKSGDVLLLELQSLSPLK